MTAYICTPYRADDKEQFDKQLAYTKEVAKHCVLEGYDVIVPHLYYPLFLDDNVCEDRKLGMKSAKNLIKKCDLLIRGTKHGLSDGMRAEIEYAKEHGIQIKVM